MTLVLVPRFPDMMIPEMKHAWLILIVLLLISSCQKEVIEEQPVTDHFELMVSPATQEFIYDSRDTGYTVVDPQLQFSFNDLILDLKEIRVRGKSALDFRRKSYVVFLNEPIAVRDRYGSSVKPLERFKLLALAMDYTYIENRVAFGILQEAGLMPLFFKFVEFRVNGETQGVYLLMEDPEQYFREIGSEFILRRGYDHDIDDQEYRPVFHFIPEERYVNEFISIYSELTQLQGEVLLQSLDKRLDLDSYLRKMGIDYLLQNGDYTDELFLYATVDGEQIRFHPIPWDYDDIFATQPHEIGRTWGMGTLFGTRYYASIEDVYEEIGHKPIYSIEDDLDYTIARDSVLFGRYKEVLGALIADLDRDLIEKVFRETRQELTPFYRSEEMVGQSAYDRHRTTIELWEQNLQEKQEWLIKRISETSEWLGGT